MRSRVAVTLAAAAAVAAIWSAPALALDVQVEPPRSGPTTTVSLEQLEPDVSGTYTLLDATGARTTAQVEGGVSIGQLLAAASADPVYSVIEIARPDGSVLLLSREQVEQSGTTPPVVYTATDGSVRFLRPSTGPSDPNAADHFLLDATLVLRQKSRSTLAVELSASRMKVDPRERVTFTASASGAAAGASYVFSWVFDDGTTRDGVGPRITHRFRRRGVYQVLVTASIAGSIRSDPAVVEITVGDPRQSERDRTGGGTNTAKGAPDSGASDGGKGAGGPGKGAGQGGGGEGRSERGQEGDPGDGGADADDGQAPPPAPPPPDPPASEPNPKPSSKPKPTERRQREQRASEAEQRQVTGSLLGGVGETLETKPLTAAMASSLLAARDGTPNGDEGDGSIPTAVPSFAVALALLGLGAAWDLRRNGSRRRRRS